MSTNNIPAMSPTMVHRYLTEIGSQWSGAGCAVELGCWLGATSVPLLQGLVQAGYDRAFWAFDRWQANESEAIKAHSEGIRLSIGQDLLPIYRRNVTAVYGAVKTLKGRIPNVLQCWEAEPIEFCIFDAPKRNPTFEKSVNYLLPHFIPGVTVFGLLDYYFYKMRKMNGGKDWKQFLAPVEFIQTHHANFRLMNTFPDGSCAFFKYIKKI